LFANGTRWMEGPGALSSLVRWTPLWRVRHPRSLPWSFGVAEDRVAMSSGTSCTTGHCVYWAQTPARKEHGELIICPLGFDSAALVWVVKT